MDSEFFDILAELKKRGDVIAILLGDQPARAKIQVMSGDYVVFKMLDMEENTIVTMHWTNVVLISKS